MKETKMEIGNLNLVRILLSACFMLSIALFLPGPVFSQSEIIEAEFSLSLKMGEYGQFPYFEISYPHLKRKNRIDLTGWDVGESFSQTTTKKLRETVDAAFEANFNIVYLRVDWKSIEPVENMPLYGLNKIASFLDEIDERNRASEDSHKVRVIIALELERPPKWFKAKHPASVMSHINPFHEKTGPMGPVQNSDGHSTDLDYGILNDPDYQKAAKKVIYDLVPHFQYHPALFGWALTSPSSPMMYPGAGKDGVGGFADYSLHSRSRFDEEYGIDENYIPLARESQGEPDLRSEWHEWNKFRQKMRRKSIDEFGMQIFELDVNHPIFVNFWGVMAYEGDNGYRSEVWGNDYFYQLTQPYVNGAIIPFQLSSKTFEYPSGVDDMDSLHQLCAAVEMAQRHQKVPLLMVEKSWRKPPRLQDVTDLAHLAVALGVDIIWSHSGMSDQSLPWHASEKATIERTAHLNNFPLPSKRQMAKIAILDYPFELSKFYAEKDKELEESLAILDAFQDAGVNYTVVTPEEISSLVRQDVKNEEIPEWLTDIKLIAPLAGNLAEYMPEIVSDFFKQLKNIDIEPYILQKRSLNAFIYSEYDDTHFRGAIQTKLGTKKLKYHSLNNNKCFVVMNWPFIFVSVAKKDRNTPSILINPEQYDDSGTIFSSADTFVLYDALNDQDFKKPLKVNLVSDRFDFILPDDKTNSYLLVWSQKIEKYKEAVIASRMEIDKLHRISLMKRSLPIALILTIVVIALGVIFTVQLYHPDTRKRKKIRKPPPVLHDHEDYFKSDKKNDD